MGKGAGSSSQQYDYYGTIAGAICAGPVDEILGIIVDGKIRWPSATDWAVGAVLAVNDLRKFENAVWKCTTAHTASTLNQPPNATYWTRYSVLRSASANPYPITVEGYGNAYLYWGTTTQTLDTVGEKTLNDNGHPPYRRQAVLVLKDFLFGREKVSAPSLEVIVRRAPNQSVVTSTPATLVDGQANPVAALADLYTDPVFGAGLTAGTLSGPDATTWQSAATAVQTNSSTTGISPVVLASKTLRDITASMLAYYDGWMRFKSDGTIEAGAFSHASAPPAFGAATTIDYNDLVSEVEYKADGWAETFNQTQVSFTDRERNFKDGSVSSVSGYNVQITSQPRTTKVDRPWITRRQQASDWAAEYQKINGEPKLSGTLVVRAEKAESIKPGDLFQLTHDAVSLTIVCRCLAKDISQAPAGRVSIRFESERALAPVPYQPTPDALNGQAYTPNEKLTLNKFFQPPASMIDGASSSAVVALVGRKNSTTTAANVWLKKQETGSTFYELAQITNFGITGTLQQAYGSTTVSTVSFARASGQSTYITSAAHNLAAGQTVTISGLSNATFNGTFTVFSVGSSTTFFVLDNGATVTTTADTNGLVYSFPPANDITESLRVTLDANTNAADLTKMLATQSEDMVFDDQVSVIVFDETGQTTTNRSRTSSVATITFGSAHRFLIGQTVTITGLGGTGFNGTFAVVDIPTPTQINVTTGGADVVSTADTGGTVTPYKTFEVMSLRNLRVQGVETFYRLKVQRNRFGTPPRIFASGSPVWIVYRADLVALEHALFESFGDSGATGTFRLQGVNAESTADLTDTTNFCPDISYTFFNGNTPKVVWTASKANGTQITNYDTFQALTTGFQFEGFVTDGSGDLVSLDVVARFGSMEVVMTSQQFTKRPFHTFSIRYTFPFAAEWQVFAIAKDSTGTTTTSQLTSPYTTTTVTIKTGVDGGAGGSTVCAQPVASPIAGQQSSASVTVTLTCATPGSTIMYSLVRGTTPGTYSTYSSALTFNVYRYGYTLFTYATKAGYTTSSVAQNYYWFGNSGL